MGSLVLALAAGAVGAVGAMGPTGTSGTSGTSGGDGVHAASRAARNATSSTSSPLPSAAVPVPPSTPGRPSSASPADNVASRLPARIEQAMAIATRHRIHAAVAIVDTASGRTWAGGAARSRFAAASTVKVLIAAQLLRRGAVHGSTATFARSMIERSDDAAARVLWPAAGGPSLVATIAARYRVPDLGAPNRRPGLWGSTQVTARGFARLLATLRHDPAVWPWLGHALRHTAPVAADGTDQRFGVLAAAPQALVKQGWAVRSANRAGDSVIDSVGYVDHERYAVVVLTEGPSTDGLDRATGFDRRQAAVTTAMARVLVR